jgi:predicted kinase
MVRLFSPDRPDEGVMEWYVERTQRCIDQIWKIAMAMVNVGTNVVLEIGLIRRRDRERLYRRVEEAGCDLVVHVLDAPREVRRQRVLRRNAERGETFSMVVPPEIFELASDRWDPLSNDEGERFEVRWVNQPS